MSNNNIMVHLEKMFKSKKIIILVFGLLFLIGCILMYSSELKEFTFDFHGMYTNCFKVQPKFNSKRNHSKWIVVTSISNPTEQLKKLIAIPDWKVIVVGDKKTPQNWSYPGCVYLSLDDQLNLGYQITKHLPYNSYTRKMIGYLYAIQNGARFIYDTDDDNCPSNGQLEFILEPSSSGLIYADLSQAVMNPYPHFGQPQLWPRGFPLERIAQAHNHTYHLCTLDTAAVQQGLVNGDPDVDAIYRLINKGSNADININVTFDIRAPPFTLPRGVFAPFNSQNTLFSYPVLWALFLPVTVDFRVTDIWRGYWAQRLLWLTGNHLAFHLPNAVQVRNPHSYLKDFKEEIQMYSQTAKFIDFLSQWECELSLSFFQCVEQLTSDMVEQTFIKERDLEVVQMWLSDLKSTGYKQPLRVNKNFSEMCLPSEITTNNWVNYSPSSVSVNSGFNDLLTLCGNHTTQSNHMMEKVNLPKYSYTFKNILLVIVFNFPLLQNVRLLEALYRDHFPNMLFCSKSSSYEGLMETINKSSLKWRRNDVSFVNVTEAFNGWYGYECAIRAIEMNYNVDGYMFLGDDVFLKPWKLLPFDPTKSRIQNDTYGPHCYQDLKNATCAHFQWNSWWRRACGYNGTNKAFREIESIANNQSDSRSYLFQTFIQNRFSNGVNMSLVSFSMCDFYYISKQDSWMFAQVLKVFLKHKVYLDIAVPTTLSGCRAESPQTDDGFLGISLWEKNRQNPLQFLTNESVYVHPLKLSSLQNDESFLRKYCLDFVQQYFNHW